MGVEFQAARQRIIRRPRLTSILDESSAQVRMLIAPAGYGKTTLARQWLGEPERRDVWYRGGPASADVAALAAGIAEAASELIPDAGKRMRDRLRATGHPEEDVDILAELFAEDVQGWPTDGWLAIDDYHFAIESAASERFVDLMTQHTPIQMLITSRRRPTWATARRILYGEILEIDRRALAMEDTEARQVLDREDETARRVLQVARGWPAVLGLVTLNSSITFDEDTLPDQLYDFFAQELYSALPPGQQIPLGELSFAGRFDRSLAHSVLGSGAETAIQVGLGCGLLSQPARSVFEIHPLLSELLQEQAFSSSQERKAAATRIGKLLLEIDRWDDAVDIATRFSLRELLLAAVESALEHFLDEGRIATVTRWLEAADSMHCQSPLLDLAEAEVAFRLGDHPKVEALAAHAATHLTGHRLLSRAYARAGHGALLGSREEKSIGYFRLAAKTATDARERREALYGLYSAMSELELPEAARALTDLMALDLGNAPDDLIRGMAIELIQSVRVGRIQQVLNKVQQDLHLLEKASNPLIVGSFLHSFSNALSLGAHYDRAFEASARLDTLIAQHRLDFARSFAHIDRAVAQIGRRQFARALKDLSSARHVLPSQGDVHIEGNLHAIGCRLLVATGRPHEAANQPVFVVADNPPSAPLHAEIVVSRALALACANEREEALDAVDMAEGASRMSPVVRVLGPSVRAICAARIGEKRRLAQTAWEVAVETGNFDSVIAAYRGDPDLLGIFAEVAGRDALAGLLQRAYDGALARERQIPVISDEFQAPLTPRECEVIDLVATGLSNKEVAQLLFVSEATVKVHLRHVYEKLNVRGRTEAAARWLARQE